MGQKLVSVIIPVYNTERYVADCINSVINQTYRNLEIIVINDGSKDNSAKVCEEFLFDSRVKFVNRENKGLSYTRQEGISLASGEYFCNLDADDMLDSQFVEKMLEKALETSADIVTCGRYDFDEICGKECLLAAKSKIYELTKESVTNSFNIFHRELWLSDSWNKLYKTEFVRKTNVEYWLNNKYNGTDLSYNHLLVLHCPKIAVLNEPLLKHRFVIGSRVHRKNKPLQEGFMLITSKFLEEAYKLGYDEKICDSYSNCYFTFMDMVFNAIIVESENKKEMIDRFVAYKNLINEFKKKYPKIILNKNNAKKGGLYNKVYYTAMMSDSVLWCLLVNLLYKIKNKGN